MIYGPAPPDGVITTEPVDAPLQAIFVMYVVAASTAGSVIFTETVIEQLFASFTVKV